jgi:cytochrome c5
VSKKDSQFFSVFSSVLGILIAITLGLMAFARSVGANTQQVHVDAAPDYAAAVAERVRPFERVAIAGQDNSALAIEAPGSAAPAAPVAAPTDGPGVYAATCTACHGAGIGGAPKAGDKAAWGPRIAQGKALLYKHALEGFQGKAGVMPAKGGRVDLSDELIRQAVDHIVSLEQ